jgi:hypothetical protein
MKEGRKEDEGRKEGRKGGREEGRKDGHHNRTGCYLFEGTVRANLFPSFLDTLP